MHYLLTISRKYPELQVSCDGPPDDYASLIAEEGHVLPSEAELDAAHETIIKEDMWIAIKAERDRRKAAGVKVGSFWFHSDDASRIQQIALVMLGANIPPNLQWKTMTGQFTTMTQTLASQVFQSSIMSDQVIFGKAEYHRTQMLAAVEPENYNYKTDWPLTFEESPEFAAYQAAL